MRKAALLLFAGNIMLLLESSFCVVFPVFLGATSNWWRKTAYNIISKGMNIYNENISNWITTKSSDSRNSQ